MMNTDHVEKNRHPERYPANDLGRKRTLLLVPRSFASTLRMTVVCAIVAFLSTSAFAARTGPFIIGADISWVPEDEAAGAKYFDHAVQKDIFSTLKQIGF